MITTRSKWCALAFAAASAASSFFSCAGLAASSRLDCAGLVTCAGWLVCAPLVDCPEDLLGAAQMSAAATRQLENTAPRQSPPDRETPCLSDILVTDSHIRSSNRIQRSPDSRVAPN